MGLFRYNLLLVSYWCFRRNFGIKLEIFENISISFFWTVNTSSLATYDPGRDQRLNWQFDSSAVRYPLVIPPDSCQYFYHYSNKQVPFITMVNDKIDDTIFLIILQLHKNHNRADVYSIHKQIIKLLILKILPKCF